MVGLQVSAFGGSPTSATIPALTVALYASSGGIPTGSALTTATVAEQVVYSSGFWLLVPLPVAVTPSTVYQLVVSQAGTASHYYLWQQSNQTSGASTSADGVSWTAQTYGLMFQVFDQSVSGAPQFLYDDSGARTVQLSYATSGALSSVTESVVAQDGSIMVTSRSLAYSSGYLIGVA